MPILRTLIFEAARRVAADPQMRARALELARREVLPRARVAARLAGAEMDYQRQRLAADWQAARLAAGADAPRAEVVGRLVRRRTRRSGD